MNLVCWKCGKGMPLYKVKNSWVFACEEHKGLEVPNDASSQKGSHEVIDHNSVTKESL